MRAASSTPMSRSSASSPAAMGREPAAVARPEIASALVAPSASVTAAAAPMYTPSSLATSLHDSLSSASLASLFLHPAAALGYPWTINLMAASNYRYNSLAALNATLNPCDLTLQRNSSIADLRLKAKRHAEELGLPDK